jgi:antitoxin (DNA-binding transcriptional repressor) of toxin-antitoxin stability system
VSTVPRIPSTAEANFRRALDSEPHSIRIRTDELRTVREAMRDFNTLLAELEAGEVEKLVLTQRNRMRAVVVSVERWSEVEQALADVRWDSRAGPKGEAGRSGERPGLAA